MIYLIDNNVLSELWKPAPAASVVAWWHAINSDESEDDWLLPVVVLAEIQEGAEAAPSPKRRAQITAALDAFLAAHSEFVLEWDAATARTWGRLKHSSEVRKQPQALWDSLIDAMAVACGCTVATRDAKGFRHAETFNPWTFSA